MLNKKKAIISGISGQDGAWLSQKLLKEGYVVYGGTRRSSNRNFERLDRLNVTQKIKFVEMDLLDYSNIFNIIKDIKPDEFYNLAAQSFVGTSFKQPISTYMVDAMAVGYILDILKTISPETKFYQASSSEMYGKVNQKDVPLDETAPFHPRSPYGVAKVFSHHATINYRESYGMFCCSGILFNHESELRGPEFVTRKISLHVANINRGKNTVLELGNIDATRDWGHAKEYCEGMWQMMQMPKSDTYVLATGIEVTVRQFLEMAFQTIGKTVIWEGEGVESKGRCKKTGQLLVKVNPDFYRPAEVDRLVGCADKAKKDFRWECKITANVLAEQMVKADVEYLKRYNWV